MIRILITKAAFKAIGGVSIKTQRTVGAARYGAPPAGMVPIFLPAPVVEALKASRWAGEDYSATIVRFVAQESA